MYLEYDHQQRKIFSESGKEYTFSEAMRCVRRHWVTGWNPEFNTLIVFKGNMDAVEHHYRALDAAGLYRKSAAGLKAGTEPTPCDVFNCPNMDQCHKGYSCEAFRHFTETGSVFRTNNPRHGIFPSTTPTKRSYGKLFPGIKTAGEL